MNIAIRKIDNIVRILEENVLIITGTAVTLMILANALFRYIQVDWFGSEELTLLTASWLYFIGSIGASRDNTHIRGDMLEMFVANKKIVYVFNLAKTVIAIAMASVFSVWVCQFVFWQYKLGSHTPVLKLPLVISLIPIPLFFIAWVIYMVRDLIIIIQNAPKREDVNNITREGGH